MTTVVTGASGHVGSNLVRTLLEQGRTVRAVIHDDSMGVDGLPVERVHADVRDLPSLVRAFEGADVVYHLAARISLIRKDRDLVMATNVAGPTNVVEACLRTGVRRLVHFSSIHALDDRPLDVPVDEKRPFATWPIYDLTKGLGQKAVLAGVERGLDAVIVHPTAVLGPYDFRISAMGQVLLDLYHGKLPALVQGGFDWVDVRDIVAGAIAAESRGRTGENYLLSGHYATVRELADVVEGVTGKRTPRMVTPMWLARFAAPFVVGASALLGREPLFTSASLKALRVNRNISHAKAARELGYTSRPLRDTIETAYAWFEEAGMLRAMPKRLRAAEAQTARPSTESSDR